MLRNASRAAAAALCLSVPAFAQSGNELIFVGTSTAGTTDPYYFIESATVRVADRGGLISTNNVTGAAWTNTGRTLYVSNSLPPGGISVAQWNGASSVWSQVWATSRACYGLGYDLLRQRVWTIDSSPGYNELVCVDVDAASPTYGTAIGQTTTLSGPIRERWALSFSGSFAIVPHLLLGSGTVDIVDTNPLSATFLQITQSVVVPGAQSAGFCMVADCAVTPDEQYALFVYTGTGFARLGALHVPTGTLVDFSPTIPGQQDYSLGLSVASSMALANTGAFAVVTGLGSGGWVARISLDWNNPGNTTHQNLTPIGGIPNCNGVSISADDSRFACANWAVASPPAPPAYLSVFDVATGARLQRLTLNSAWNVYTTAWQDASPVATYTPFGSGCLGTLGAPLLRAANGSRPGLGLNFAQEILNVPSNIAIASLGFSNGASGGLPLPLDLTAIGMNGCTMWVDPAISTFLFTASTTASMSYSIPSDPYLFGLPIYTQGWAYDPAANTAGWTATDGGMGWVGL